MPTQSCHHGTRLCGLGEGADADEEQNCAQGWAQGAVGHFGGEVRAYDDAGNGANKQAADEAIVDVAGEDVADCGDGGEKAAVVDVGADCLLGLEAEDQYEGNAEEGAAADGRQADEEAARDSHGYGPV